MPINEPGVPTSTAQAEPTEHRVSPREVYGPPTPDPYSQRIGIAQANSNNLVPVRTIMDLANLNAENRDIAIAARKMAAQWDVSPQVFFGQRDPRKVVSHITGQPVSMAEAQRFTNYYSPVALASMLGQTLDISRIHRGSKNAQIATPQRLGQFANVLSRNTGFDLTTGLALAYHVSNTEAFSPKTFEQNLPLAKAWLSGTTGQAPSDQAVVSVAVRLSQKGVAHTVGDVPTMLYGKATVVASQRTAANIQQRITYGTPEERQKAYQEELAQTQAIEVQGQAQVIPGQVNAEGMLGPDYWSQVNDIANQVQISQNAFHNSRLGKMTAWTFGGLNHVYHATEKSIWDGALGVGTVLTTATGAFSGHLNLAENYQTLIAAHQDSWRRIEAGQNIGDFTRDGWSDTLGVHLPDWTGSAMDFLLLWELDPFSVGGKVSRLAREERLLPEIERAGLVRNALGNALLGQDNLKLLEEGGNLGETGVRGVMARSLQKSVQNQFDRYFKYTQETLPKSFTSRRIFDSLGDFTKYDRELDFTNEGAVANRTLDRPFMYHLRESILNRYGDGTKLANTARADAWNAWQEGLRAHFLGWGPEGSVARETALWRDAVSQNSLMNLNDALVKDPEALSTDMSQTATIAQPELGWHQPYSQEAPTGSIFQQLGPRRLTRRVMTGPRFTETSLGKAVSTLPNMNPGREMPLSGPRVPEHFLADARRTRVFSETEARIWAQRATDIQSTGNLTETALEDLRKEMDHTFVKKLIGRYGATQDDVTNVYSRLYGPSTDMNLARQEGTGFLALGPTEESLITGQPQFTTQLRNSIYTTDPVEVRAAIRQYLGDYQMMKSHLRNILGVTPGEFAKNEHIAHAIASSTAQWSQDVLRDFRHLWKALIVARPGYIPRVVLGDENMRFLSVTNSITERILSQELFAGWGDRLGYFDRVWRDAGGEEFARVKLPGSFERNPLAVNDVRGAELREDILRGAARWDKQMQAAPLSWGNVIHASPASVPTGVTGAVVDEGQQMTAWTWALSKQVAQDSAGQVALRSVMAGDDVATTQAKLLDWAKADHYQNLRGRIGVDPEHTTDWANQVASGVHIYTMDNPALADVALHADAKDLRQVLENVPVENRPPVHGASLDDLFNGSQYGPVNRFINGMYKWMVRKPEAAWNRHPFFKAMKRRAEIGYYNILDQAVKEDSSILSFTEKGFSPRVFQPGEDVSAIGWDSNYYAHLTPKENIEPIRTQGVLPKQQFYGIPPENVRPEMQGGRAFLADDPNIAMNATKSLKDKVLIRIPRSDVPATFPDTAMAGSQFARAAVDTSHAEILGADGGWHAMADTERGIKGLPPSIRQAIDHASTQFALDQVERVMFDFTKQSRFTELLQFLTPFPQPFFEGFQAWGHIIRRNPATVARAQALYRLGVNANFIHKDPLTGEEVVDMNWLKFPTRLLDAVLPGDGTHSEELMNKLGVNFVAPLANFNLLAQSTVHLPTNWPLVQGAPLPFPGLRPELATLGQWAFKNTTNETLTSMLFQYGPHTNFIPRQLAAVLDAISPQQFKFKEEDSLVLSILRAYQTNHVYFDAKGNPSINPDTKVAYTRDEIIAHAQADAQHLARLRNWLSLVSPASLHAETAATPNEALFQTYVNDAPNFSAALDKWHKDHPDLWLTPIGKTLYEGYVTNPVTQQQFRGPRLPSSEFVMRLLNTPKIGDLMRHDKAWAGLLLLGLPSSVTQAQDFPTYSRLLASGDFRYRTPQEFWDAGESGIVQNKLSEIYTQYDARLQILTEKHVSSQDPAYGAAKDFLQTQFQQLARDHPTWVQANLDYNDGQYSWPQGRGRPIETVVAQARQITQTAGFEGFPGVKALGDYLTLRDRIKAKMTAKGYTDIMQGGDAQTLADQYARGVQKISDATPGFGPYLSAMFGVYVDKGNLVNTDDLRVLQSSRSAAWEQLRTKNPQMYTAAQNFDTYLNSLSPYYKQYDTKWQRSADYYKVQQFADKTYGDHPEVVNAWWKTIGKPAQRDYLHNLAYTPAQYYNRFQWHLSGVNLTDKGAAAMQGLAHWWVEYEKAKNSDPNLDSGAAFKALNTAVQTYAKGAGKSNGFDKAVTQMNDWAFPLKAAGLADQPGRLGKSWGAVIDAVTATQKVVVRDQISGVSGNAKNLNQWYSDTQTRFMSWVRDHYFSHDPAFKKQWYEVQSAAGTDPLVGSIILPDTYYGPLGWVDYGKGV